MERGDAARMAVDYLVSLGHRHIGALWGEFVADETQFPRLAGFRAAVRQAGITAIEEAGETHPDNIHKGYLQMRRLLERSDRPTAVFARKPWPEKRAMAPDFVAWEAPARYLVGYGMDAAGEYRGLPYISALD